MAVDTAPAMVWSMYQGKAGNVHPKGPLVVLRSRSGSKQGIGQGAFSCRKFEPCMQRMW